MSAVRITLRAPREEVTHWLSMAGASVLFHVTVFAAVLWVPQFFQNRAAFPDVYTVDLVALPAGMPGPPGGAPRASAPAPAPAPARQEPAVKIPEKPEAKIPKAKPPKKAEPVKPRSEKAEAKAPSAQAAATSGASEAGTGTAAEGGTGSGAPGGIPGGTGGAGGSLLVGDATFAYGWYLDRMLSLIEGNWSRPILTDLTRTLRAGVRFVVQRDGTLTNIELAQPSGDATVDRSVIRAVTASSPLPPLPYQYGKESLEITIFFNLKPD